MTVQPNLRTYFTTRTNCNTQVTTKEYFKFNSFKRHDKFNASVEGCGHCGLCTYNAYDDVTSTYKAAVEISEAEKWKEAVDDEIKSL